MSRVACLAHARSYSPLAAARAEGSPRGVPHLTALQSGQMTCGAC